MNGSLEKISWNRFCTIKYLSSLTWYSSLILHYILPRLTTNISSHCTASWESGDLSSISFLLSRAFPRFKRMQKIFPFLLSGAEMAFESNLPTTDKKDEKSLFLSLSLSLSFSLSLLFSVVRFASCAVSILVWIPRNKKDSFKKEKEASFFLLCSLPVSL